MDFLKAVLLAVLIHIIAPLVVRYVETNYPIHRVEKTQHGMEGARDSTRLHG